MNLSVENCNNFNVMYQHIKVEQCFYAVIFGAGRPLCIPARFFFLTKTGGKKEKTGKYEAKQSSERQVNPSGSRSGSRKLHALSP
jgi:hypothetical protein